MWEVYEHRNVLRRINTLPREILKRYEKWKDIVRLSGPKGLRFIKGFHDESLEGKWKGYRASRLGLQYRVIYQIVHEQVHVLVFDITSHDYRRK